MYSLGFGCPYCRGRYASVTNNLKAVNPVLAKQWHPTRNAVLTAADVPPGSNRIVWWQCSKGHEWKANVLNRSKGTACHIAPAERGCVYRRDLGEILCYYVLRKNGKGGAFLLKSSEPIVYLNQNERRLWLVGTNLVFSRFVGRTADLLLTSGRAMGKVSG